MENSSEPIIVVVIIAIFFFAYVWVKSSRKSDGINSLIGNIPGNTDIVITPPIILIYDTFEIYDSLEFLLTDIEEWQFDNELAIDAYGQVITFRMEDGRHSYSYSVINRPLLNAVLESMCLNSGLSAEEIEDLDNAKMYEILRKQSGN